MNSAGLAVGMAASLLMMLWAGGEPRFNRFPRKMDDTYSAVELPETASA